MRWEIFVQYLAIFLVWGPEASFAVRRDDMCRFPAKWEGTWFQSGVRSLITIEANMLSSKGRCLASDGDKFLVVDDKSVCYRCIVIHEKHINVLQYKETFCHDRNNLYSLCSLITGDALLYSMFRLNAQPVHCPFKPPMTFTYSRGHGECRNPVSSIDACIEESRIVLRYQACPDVSGTESAVEELECVATWKEGSSRYLVGKVSHNHITSNEDRFRCFVYEKANPLQSSENTLNRNEGYHTFLGGGDYGKNHENFDFRLAQSGDATCNGLFSPMEGSRTMALKKAPIPNRCKYPMWMTYFQHWHTLDYRKTFTFHHRNTTIRIANNSAVDGSNSSNEEGTSEVPVIMATTMGLNTFLSDNGEIRLVCSEIKVMNQTQGNIVAHITVGCQSGYICLWFYRRDMHVIEIQSGQMVRRSEDACHQSNFNFNMPFVTLVTTNPEQRDCPYNGKFSVVGAPLMERQKRSAVIPRKAITGVNSFRNDERGENDKGIERERMNGRRKRREETTEKTEEPETCEDESTTLEVGCEASDGLQFQSRCTAAPNVISAYTCHGRWTENETNFLIATPLIKTSIDSKRYCFVYREVAGVIHLSSLSQTCTRNINPGVDGIIAFNATNIGQCQQTNHGEKIQLDLLLLYLVIGFNLLR